MDFATFYANITSKAADTLGVGDSENSLQRKVDQIRRPGTAALDGDDEMMDEGEARAEGGADIASQVAHALRNLRDQALS